VVTRLIVVMMSEQMISSVSWVPSKGHIISYKNYQLLHIELVILLIHCHVQLRSE